VGDIRCCVDAAGEQEASVQNSAEVHRIPTTALVEVALLAGAA